MVQAPSAPDGDVNFVFSAPISFLFFSLHLYRQTFQMGRFYFFNFFRNNYDCLDEGIHHNCTIQPDETRQLPN